MDQRFTSSVATMAFAGALVFGFISVQVVGRAAAATNRTVYVSVVDRDGVPVSNIQATDLEVKEGGKTMDIVSVRPATTSLRIAIVDSDAGTGAYQTAVQVFMNKLLGRAEFALTSVIVQATKVHDYSSDPAVLVKGLDAVGRRGLERGGQLMEAIMDVAKSIRAEGKRSIIVVMRVGGEAAPTMSSEGVRDQLRKSGAILYAFSYRGVDPGTPQSISKPDAAHQALRDNEQTVGANTLQEVLSDGSRDSGGHDTEVVAAAAAKMLASLADEILHQYEVVYAVPEGVKSNDKLQVSTKLKNATVYAPNHPPN